MAEKVNWKERLAALSVLSDEELFNHSQYPKSAELYELSLRAAENWCRCYCGEKVPQEFKDNLTGAPIDNDLWWLGVDFVKALKRRRWPEAYTVMDNIDARILTLQNLANINTPTENSNGADSAGISTESV